MIPAKIYSKEWEVNERLAQFNVSRSELIEVVRSTLAERKNTVDADVLNAAGMLSYIHGTRHLRFLLNSRGYEIDREKNVESCSQPNSGIKIIFQNVDSAANHFRSPKAVSGKKSGSANAIENAQGSLFSADQIPEVIRREEVDSLVSSVWYFCVYFDDDTVRAELSLPAGVKNQNFSGFIERIFIIEDDGWANDFIDESDQDDVAEFEPKIVRK